MNIQIKMTKKAKEIIHSFSEREKAVYELLINFYHNSAEIIENSNRKIKIYNNKAPRYPLAIKEQMNAEFRLKYLFDCLGLRVYLDYSTLIIHIN